MEHDFEVEKRDLNDSEDTGGTRGMSNKRVSSVGRVSVTVRRRVW